MRWTGCLARTEKISRYDFQSRIAEVLITAKQRLTSLSMSFAVQYCHSLIFVEPLLSHWSVMRHRVHRRVIAVVGICHEPGQNKTIGNLPITPQCNYPNECFIEDFNEHLIRDFNRHFVERFDENSIEHFIKHFKASHPTCIFNKARTDQSYNLFNDLLNNVF